MIARKVNMDAIWCMVVFLWFCYVEVLKRRWIGRTCDMHIDGMR